MSSGGRAIKRAGTLKDTLNSGIQVSNAFEGYRIDSSDFLDDVEGRSKCPNCLRSRKFFCYNCYLPMPCIEGRIPHLLLPLKIDIIKHRQEIDGKSTATHGPILAPESVQIHTYPNIPDTSKAILIYPSDDAEDADTFMKRTKEEYGGIFPYERVIFIDSTWNQTYKICHDPNIVDLPRVKLDGIESLFWRYQRGNPVTHMATIEAVHHFCIAYHKTYVNSTYEGEYDNLLFFFRYMFYKIRQLYDPKSLRAYATRPHLRD